MIKKTTTKKPARITIGWREWVALPTLGVHLVKAKVDTGARTSSLHAFDLDIVRERGREVVHFVVHPFQRDTSKSVRCKAPLDDMRWVTSSNGKRELRPVIVTPVTLLDDTWMIELTLSDRDSMGFRMLLGREAIRRRFLVNPGRSFLAGRVKRTRKKGKTKRKP